MAPITSLDAALHRVPLDRPLHDAMHGEHTHFELVTATIRTADGAEGTGYTYTGGRGGSAILAMLRDAVAPVLTGRDAASPETCHDSVLTALHYVGRGGILAFAASAADIALWDMKGRREGRSLAAMAGGRSRTCRAYRGGIDLGDPTPDLLRDVSGYLETGFEAVKIKVGRADDEARVAAVRDLIGARPLMVDANYGFTPDEAIARARAFAPHDVTWFEEPVDPDDLAGTARVAEEGGLPVAMGENLHMTVEFARALREARLSYLQPDASNCGGITGFLRAAALADAHGAHLCSHGMQELHVSLLAGLGGEGWLEVHSFPIDRLTERPLQLEGGRAVAPDTPGVGVRFDPAKLTPLRVD